MQDNLFTSIFKLIPKSFRALVTTIICFAFLNIALEKLASYFDPGYLRMRDINSKVWKKGADFIFLGDSRAHQGLVPTEFSKTAEKYGWEIDAINLGRPGMQLPFVYFIADKIIRNSDKKPKAIVLNLSFYLLGGEQWMKDIYFSYYRPSMRDIFTQKENPFTKLGGEEWYFRTRLPVWKLRARADTLMQSYLRNPKGAINQVKRLNKQRELYDFSISNGYLSRGYKSISEKDVKPAKWKIGFERGYSSFLTYFEMLIETAEANGIDIYLYRFPWPEKRKEEKEFNKVLDYYWDYLKKYNNDSIVFMDTKRFWPVEFFVDHLHLNHKGAKKLSRQLAAEIYDIRIKTIENK